MKINVDIDESELVNLDEYADWHCSILDMKRTGNAGPDAKVRVAGSEGAGTFDLPSLTVSWDDGRITDVRDEIESLGYWNGAAEDFDATALVWGEADGKTVLWGV